MEAAVEPLKGRRIYLLLRERISSGALAVGDRLPGEPTLAAEFGVSRMTLRRALDRLVQENMLERRAGVGTFVHDRDMPHRLRADLSDVFANLREMGRQSSVRLLNFAYVNPPDTITAALNLPSGSRTQRSERVRMMDGVAFSHLTTHVPEAIGATYSEAELASTPLLGLLERSGVVADRATQTMTATLAGPDVAEALEVEIGAPLLSLTRVVHDRDGQGVEHLHALYRPDRFTFQMELLRTGRLGSRRWRPLVASDQPDTSPATESRSRPET
ncbi:MAG: GntR family transcriptional regulator [Acetobacteraceae bacterium]|nr:GntR family transcriptional regulator [Acetobacteraceae bacterium]